ncbi:response regulator [Varunaivibrio sulfuroxidans]|uniref:Response regulator receiver domain-containing protein n=1 Tax=Varunaivibrio sulfuroxidans TaxID=1773489 RepID=A0A4R3J8D3_9PROT|nr:response regulator [Varunaivibrio sulfuroxidans]TCS62098.1 response regulator receiver domain-containing protein [Varunaivibrio sulfuroxidans]WES30531.1 response regulator [Varunaivibrio sulfuroxidans]
MAEYDLTRLNFLIVDDNKHMRALVKSILHALGVKNVLEAQDGADAFKELRHFPADMIICDWNMSPLDGLDFVRLVRTGADSPNPFVPIIMLTGHTEMNRVMEARDSGVHEFLAKPISAKKLYSRIRSIIEQPRPFVRAGLYFGPDRRRKTNPNYSGPERRKENQGESSSSQEEPGELSQDEVNALLNG